MDGQRHLEPLPLDAEGKRGFHRLPAPDAGGVLGGSAAAVGASFATGDSDTILGSSLVGASVGFAGGALLGTSLAGKTRDVAFLVPPHTTARFAMVPTVFPSDDGALPGAIIVVDHW